MKQKNILVSGSFSVGKSSIIESLEKNMPENERIVTHDLARWWLNNQNLRSDQLTMKEKQALQLFVCAGYVGAIKQAAHAQVVGVMDGSLIEAYAYSEGVLSESIMDKIRERLMKYKEHSIAYVIPPTIHLENDGLRHTDKEFRVAIHERVLQVIDAFCIPSHTIVSQDIEDRVEEIMKLHKQYE